MIKNLKLTNPWRGRSLYAIASAVIFMVMSNTEIHPVLKIYLVLLQIQAITALIYFLPRLINKNRVD